MFKLFAIILLVSAFALAGKWGASFQERRVTVMNEMMLMINVVESQLRHSHLPVTDLLRVLCENSSLSGLDFLKNCRERMCFGEPFPDAWRKSVESETELCRLLPGIKSNLAAFGSDIGSTDLESQISGCEYYRQIFSSELDIQREKNQKYKKIFPPLGLLLGISVAIMML